jgi:hypothetical protein
LSKKGVTDVDQDGNEKDIYDIEEEILNDLKKPT